MQVSKRKGGKEKGETIAWALFPTVLSELHRLALKQRLWQGKAMPALFSGVRESSSHHTGAFAAQGMVTGTGSSPTTLSAMGDASAMVHPSPVVANGQTRS